MRILLKVLLISMLSVANAHAIECYITVVKASCWKNYDVSVTVTDAKTNAELGKITVYEGSMWKRDTFSCKEGQTLALTAKFVPEFWSGDAAKEFKSIRFWRLPEKAGANAIGWNIKVCYPKWFANVPVPPDAGADCDCDMSAVPAFKVDS